MKEIADRYRITSPIGRGGRAGRDCAADGADQVDRGGGQDSGGVDQLVVAGGMHGDGETTPVGAETCCGHAVSAMAVRSAW
ncbi:hypothetical protein [Nocardia arizonensis]|uniref:hypothetical protein n=1 Tax=Nocardia arizonensis TaxID=1141647 RepID=UPI0006CFB105|nr:hypothetical protein [Nocardia arizonensis]